MPAENQPARDQPHVVTGAFGYTGAAIARRLLQAGRRVRTLTNHPREPNPFGAAIEVASLDFADFKGLVRNLEGAAAFYNTYWLRYPLRGATHTDSVENTLTLMRAARDAGVGKFVHVSITNAARTSPLSYFRGKGVLEEELANSGLPFAILRPTVIFGAGDVLINNIAWMLRRFPIFAIPGAGDYRLQPVFVEDLAEIAIAAADGREDSIIDAAGPDVYRFDELVRLIADAVGSRARIVRVNPALALGAARLIGFLMRDVTLTSDEIAGLTSNLLIANGTPVGRTRFSEWLRANADQLGTRYASELARRR
ncbi:MAG TPA: NAD-dependent epimerase/dehydratase family protein [Candidatus Binataceae bacterium]|nr:NAD-dependent epimerase/dehydratase family protein [Candidatus Binataceae bacterium]